eukprot:TRINITY_DN4399_c0_g1_i1.p1 TRINITY_DN4399_c0_g1~~TRINITY_DN4399_c0_g1_i1.p1  ORF type:complete len:475 (-),score=112.03 TRINITY_DN4399_c0_g1_i1:179-1603(-)
MSFRPQVVLAYRMGSRRSFGLVSAPTTNATSSSSSSSLSSTSLPNGRRLLSNSALFSQHRRTYSAFGGRDQLFPRFATSSGRVPQDSSDHTSGSSSHHHRHFHASASASKPKDDFYETLGVRRDATQKEIKGAFRKLAKKWHPDTNKTDPNAATKFTTINNAYEVLSNEEKRKMYDTYGAAGVDQDFGGGGGGHPGGMGGFDDIDAETIFEAFGFGGFGGKGGGRQGGRPRAARGADVEVPIRLSFVEAAKGCEKEIQYTTKVSCDPCSGSGAKAGTKPVTCGTCQGSGQQTVSTGFFSVAQPCKACSGSGSTIKDPCKTCHGQGVKREMKKLDVNIPAGVDNGNNIRVPGQGEAGPNGSSSGHLYIRVNVDKHKQFKRDNLDIHLEVPVQISEACLGGSVRVPTLTGEVEVKVPSGTQPGEKRVLRNRGIKKIHSSQYGHFYIHFNIVIPRNLNDKQKALMEEFGKSLEENKE